MEVGFFDAQRQNDTAEEDDVWLLKVKSANFARAQNVHHWEDDDRQKTSDGYGQSWRQPENSHE